MLHNKGRTLEIESSFPGGLVVKNPPANAGDTGSTLGWKDSLEEEMATLSQYSCLGNPMDRGAWWATVHSITESWTRLKQLSTAHSI